MSEFSWFIIGVVVGGLIGLITAACLSASHDETNEWEENEDDYTEQQ